MNLNTLKNQVGEINRQNGFHQVPFNLGEKLMLITTELAECLEADRISKHSDLTAFKTRYKELTESINLEACNDIEELQKEIFKNCFKLYIKEGVEAEVVDAFIRILDLAYILEIDLDELVPKVLYHNSLRGFKHGKQY